MKNNVPGRITESLISVGAVPPEDKAIYEYGIKMGLFMVINVATAVLIGLMLGMIWQSIVFLLAYNPVRSYVGGYHASTQLNCYLLSIPMMLAMLLAIKLVPWNGYICILALLCAVVVIEILAPVEDPNKPLNEREKKVYKGRARIYSATLSGAAIILWFAGMKQISLSIVMALVVAAVMLILGAIKNRRIIEEKA
ncbi:MAG: accessory gene regulator B family protein [Bacillota bacterium]